MKDMYDALLLQMIEIKNATQHGSKFDLVLLLLYLERRVDLIYIHLNLDDSS